MNTILIIVTIYLLIGALLTARVARATDWFSDVPYPTWLLALVGVLLWPIVIIVGLRELGKFAGPCG